MYFDGRPKIRKEDLYAREKELECFSENLSHAPLIVITGLRRTGKTSFLNVALNQSKQPYAIIDLRDLPFNPANADIIRRLNESFSKMDRSRFSGLGDALKHLRGVEVFGNKISLGWGKKGVDIAELFDEIDSWAEREKKQFLVAFDEIQLIRGDKWIPSFFAHVYDYNRHTTLVLTGSECGLMFDFLGFDDPKAPLYGRYYVRIQMENFSAQQAKDFLSKGFKQIDVPVSSEVLDYAVNRLDGIAGWLTLFGSRCYVEHTSSKVVVDEVVDEGGKLAREEALRIAAISKRYGVVLNFLAGVDQAGWGQIKAQIEANEGKKLNSSAVSKVLNSLVKSAFLQKTDEKYALVDPLLRHAILEEPLPISTPPRT